MIFKRNVPKDLRMRKGRVFIDEDILRNYPEDILAILAHFIVTRVEFLHCYGGFEYQGYSHLFEPCPPGCELPTYDFYLTRNWRGQVTTIDAVKQ